MHVIESMLKAKFHEALSALVSISCGQFGIALINLALFGLRSFLKLSLLLLFLFYSADATATVLVPASVCVLAFL